MKNKFLKKYWQCKVLLFSLISIASAQQVNLVGNGDFEQTTYAQSHCEALNCPTTSIEDMEAYWEEKGTPWTLPAKRVSIPLSPDVHCDNQNHFAHGVPDETICQELLGDKIKVGKYYTISFKVKGLHNIGMGFAFTKKRPKQGQANVTNLNTNQEDIWVHVPNNVTNNSYSAYTQTFMALEDADWITFSSHDGWQLDDVTLYHVAAPAMQTCCPYNLVISNKTFTSSDEIKANNKITVDGPSVVISNNSQVTFSAGKTVEIIPGIDVNPGSGYVSIINQPCTGNENFTPSVDFLPNVFTPNGDGINDEFCLRINDATDFDFHVFDADGALVKVITSQNIEALDNCLWDGTCGNNTPACNNGNELPDGTYFFTLSLRWCGNLQIFAGNLLLIRGGNRLAQSDSVARENTKLNNEIIEYQKKKTLSNNEIKTHSIQINPNPNNGQFTIITDNQHTNITIRNLLSEVVYQTSSISSMNEINLGDNAKGIYFVTLKGEGINETKKIIIE